MSNSRFGDYPHLIYSNELEVKDTTDPQQSASYFDLYPEIDIGGRLKTNLYDIRDIFTFPIVNFPFICSNIPAAPAWRLHFKTHRAQYNDLLDITQLAADIPTILTRLIVPKLNTFFLFV